MKLSLKNPEVHRPYLGQHLDIVLDAAMKNGYACDVYYDEPLPIRSAGRQVLSLKVGPKGIVTQIR